LMHLFVAFVTQQSLQRTVLEEGRQNLLFQLLITNDTTKY
jgi:hypothetical protein